MKHRNGHIAPPFLHRSGQFLAGAVFEGTGRGAAKAKAQRDQQNWVVELSAIDYCIYIYIQHCIWDLVVSQNMRRGKTPGWPMVVAQTNLVI